jgi:hypothetical protein
MKPKAEEGGATLSVGESNGDTTRPSQVRHEAEKTQGSSAADGGESEVNGLGAGLRIIE